MMAYLLTKAPQLRGFNDFWFVYIDVYFFLGEKDLLGEFVNEI